MKILHEDLKKIEVLIKKIKKPYEAMDLYSELIFTLIRPSFLLNTTTKLKWGFINDASKIAKELKKKSYKGSYEKHYESLNIGRLIHELIQNGAPRKPSIEAVSRTLNMSETKVRTSHELYKTKENVYPSSDERTVFNYLELQDLFEKFDIKELKSDHPKVKSAYKKLILKYEEAKGSYRR